MSDYVHPPVTLDDMISQSELLDQYPWLSPQILHRWNRRRLVRMFRGRSGEIVYSKADLGAALTNDMEMSIEDEESRASPSPISRPASPHTDSEEVMQIKEKLALRKLLGRKEKSLPGQNLSGGRRTSRSKDPVSR